MCRPGPSGLLGSYTTAVKQNSKMSFENIKMNRIIKHSPSSKHALDVCDPYATCWVAIRFTFINNGFLNLFQLFQNS